MLLSDLIDIESGIPAEVSVSVQQKQLLIPKDSQTKALIIPQNKLDTSLNSVLRKVDLRDRKQAVRKALLKKELELQKAKKDSLLNIYTGNPGLYGTEGDTINFGNIQYLPDSLFLAEKKTVVEKPAKPYGIEGKIIHSQNQDWLLGILLIVWIIFASIRTGFGNYIKQVIEGLVNMTSATRLYHERSYKTLYGAVQLNIIFCIILPLAVFQILQYYNVNLPGYPDFIFYIVLFIAINSYFLIKFFLYGVLGSVLMFKEKIDESVFHIRMHNKVLGIILLPVTTIYSVQGKITGILIWVILGTIGLFYLESLFRSIYVGTRKGISIFYLILYLCMLEILPLILGLKILAGE